MVYIEYELLEPNKCRVIFQMFKPERLSEERKKSGIMIDSIPAPEEGRGVPSLFVNPETKELWYEYEPLPEPPLYLPTREGQMQKEIDDLKLLIAELIAGGAA
ncbi:hypothetical protein SCACP_10770 [Sporomusa carbonis]|uniref:hypothetical protein n=1 Tax=Sporomusa carbonis TaxID=3076075 RepID=UPI003A7209F1